MPQVRLDATLGASGVRYEVAVALAMDEDALRTHHVIAALAIGLGFAGLSVVMSPIRRLSRKLSMNFPGSGLGHGRRMMRRMDEPLA